MQGIGAKLAPPRANPTRGSTACPQASPAHSGATAGFLPGCVAPQALDYRCCPSCRIGHPPPVCRNGATGRDAPPKDAQGFGRKSLTHQRPSPTFEASLNDRAKESKGRHMPADLAPGAKAPAFSLPRDGGGTVSLADFKGQNLGVFFYPRAHTPGCTLESQAFSALATAFAKAGTAVLGVSADPV